MFLALACSALDVRLLVLLSLWLRLFHTHLLWLCALHHGRYCRGSSLPGLCACELHLLLLLGLRCSRRSACAWLFWLRWRRLCSLRLGLWGRGSRSLRCALHRLELRWSHLSSPAE